MEAPAKRAADAATKSNVTAADVGGITKRRRPSATANSFRPPPPPLKLSPGETLFRILCPVIKTGGVIGKGGSIIRQFRDETGAKIRIDEAVPGCDERVIFIVAETLKKAKENDKEEGDGGNDEDSGDLEVSQAQKALVRVFERILKVDEEREGEERENAMAVEETEGSIVCCRLLAASNLVGCVIGKGGKIVEKIREESGAQIRILPKDQIPACAASGDELIQITGKFSAVKKALLSVSSCLQDNPKADTTNFATTKPSGAMIRGTGPPAQVAPFPQRSYVPGPQSMDYHSRGYTIPGQDSTAAGHRNVLEGEVIFRLLCSNDKVGSLIGKGGTIVRALQNETGAAIMIQDGMPDSEERVVLISAQESSELKHSPAQDAVMRVHSRISETGFEKVATVSARLLVPLQQIGCLLGKGGTVIAEMRKATGASIRIFVKELVPRCASPNDEVVQVMGSLQSVQGALLHITSKILETIFPMRPSPPLIRSRQELTSPGHYSSSIGLLHGMDPAIGVSQTMDHQPSLSRGTEGLGLANGERIPYPYSRVLDRPSSPRSWAPETLSSGNPRGISDIGMGFASISGGIRSESQTAVVTNTSVEVVVPQQLLRLVYGENSSNLNQIRQISGAKVVIHDPRPGATEGTVVISGRMDQTHAAQSLLQAFILCEQNTP